MSEGHYLCRACSATWSLGEPRWRCDCGGLLDIDILAHLEPERIVGRQPSLWRYREALPIESDRSIISFAEGFTPLLEVSIKGHSVKIKQDHLFPTGSYKDRGAALLISKVRELGIREVVEDSSGNAGCAVAAYCARAGIACTIYVPEDTSPAKVVQIERYGARLVRVPGTREDTARVVWEAAQRVYYASHSWNPWFFQGTKTWAYEVCEQLGWRAPDTVVLPVGNGTLLLGAAIGFGELYRMGLISRPPRIIAVQAAQCSPLADAFPGSRPGAVYTPAGHTMAEGIAIAEPIRGAQVIEAVRESGGEFVTVSEEEIETWLQAMCRLGFYIEPTSAAAIAGVAQYVRRAGKELVVSTFTGHGLKATDKMMVR